MASRSETSRRRPTAAGKVLIADDRPLVRAGLSALLRHCQIVGQVDLQDIGRSGELPDANLLIVGVREDQPLAFHLIARVTATQPQIPVLVIADSASVSELREAVIAGVTSFLLLSATTEELEDAVTRTIAGERVVAPSIAMQLASSWRAQSDQQGAGAVTDQERAVLRLVADGLTNEQISARMGVPSRSVKTHIQNVLGKLGVPDRTAAVARAIRLGLIN